MTIALLSVNFTCPTPGAYAIPLLPLLLIIFSLFPGISSSLSFFLRSSQSFSNFNSKLSPKEGNIFIIQAWTVTGKSTFNSHLNSNRTYFKGFQLSQF